MQSDHVRIRQEDVQRDVFPEGASLVAGERIVREHPHPHRLSDLPGRPADPPKADDPHRLAVQLDQRIVPKAPVGTLLPAPGVHRLAVMGHMVADFEQHRDRILPDGGGPVGGDVADGDAALPRGGDVHDVVAGRQHADKPERGTVLDDLPRERDLVGVDRLGVPDPFPDQLRRRAVVDRQLAERLQALPAQVAGVFGISVQHHNFHNLPPYRYLTSTRPSSAPARMTVGMLLFASSSAPAAAPMTTAGQSGAPFKK